MADSPIKRVEVGGDVQLTGFRDLDEGERSAAERIIAGYERRFREIVEGPFELKLTLKTVHAKEKSEKHEIHANLFVKGMRFESDVTERNLFEAIDSALTKIEHEIKK